MGPLKVEIIAYAPTAFYHCQHCELVWDQTGFSQGVRLEQINNGLPQDLLREYAAVSDWVRQLFAQYYDRVLVKVIDAASIEGMWKSVQYGVHRFHLLLPVAVGGGVPGHHGGTHGRAARCALGYPGAGDHGAARRSDALSLEG